MTKRVAPSYKCTINCRLGDNGEGSRVASGQDGVSGGSAAARGCPRRCTQQRTIISTSTSLGNEQGV